MDEAAKQLPFNVELGRPKRNYNQNLAAVFHVLDYPEAMYALHNRVRREFDVLIGPPKSERFSFRPKIQPRHQTLISDGGRSSEESRVRV